MPLDVNNQGFNRMSTMSLYQKKRIQIDSPAIIIIIFCLLAYYFFHDYIYYANNLIFRLWFSIIILVLTLPLLYVYPRRILPLVFGVATVMYTFMSIGVLYGGGYHIYYLLVLVIVMLRLPNPETITKIHLKGLIPISIFFIWCLVSIILTEIKYSEFNYSMLIQIVTFILMVYVLYKRIDVIIFNKILESIFLGNTLLLVSIIVYEYSFKNLLKIRLGESVGINPNMVGSYATISLISLLFIIILKKKKLNIFHCIFILFLIAITFFAASRSAMIQIIIIISLFVIKRKELIGKKQLWFIVLGLALIVGTTNFVMSDRFSHTTWGLFKESHQYERMKGIVTADRTSLDELSWRLAREHPLLGVGVGNFTKYSEKYGLLAHDKSGLYHHNAIVGTAAECGFPGLILFLLWYCMLLCSRSPMGKWCEYIIALGLCALVGGITHGLFLNFPGSLLLFLAISMQNIQEQK